MASSLTKDSVVILRIDGRELKEFIDGPQFDSDIIPIISQIQLTSASLDQNLLKALELLTVEHGMPPISNTWVFANFIEPVMQSLRANPGVPFSQSVFVEEFKKVVGIIVSRLQENPVILAHQESTLNGSSVKRLLSNKLELHKLLSEIWRDLPKDSDQELPKVDLQSALDRMSVPTDLPLFGDVDQIDEIRYKVLSRWSAGEKKIAREEDFKEAMLEILGSLKSQLEEKPIFVSSYSVVHAPSASHSEEDLSVPLSESDHHS